VPFHNLTEGEMLALFIFLNVAEQFRGTPLEETFNHLGEKLKLALPDSLQMNYEDFEMLLSPFLMPLAMRVDVSQVFSELFRAITERKRVLISYYSLSSRQITERKVDPYHIYNFEGVWYFCGFCHLRGEIRDFALDRVQEVKMLEESFVRPPDFSPRDYLSQAFRMYRGEATQIRIRFDSYQAAWIKERIWHPTQEIEELPDGGIIFTICGHPEEIKRWVIGYGAHAEILEPEYLRQEVEKEMEKLQEIYHNDRK